MESQIIEKIAEYGIGGFLAWYLLQIIKEQLKDLRHRIENQASLSLRNDQQLTRQIYNHGERLRKAEETLSDISNIIEAKRKRDFNHLSD